MTDLDVFIVTYRSEAYLPQLLSDLRSMSKLRHSLKVYDNYGNQRSLTALWNDLWKESKGDFVCYLNPDIRLSHGWDEKLVSCLQTRSNVAVAMGNRYVSGVNGHDDHWIEQCSRSLETATPHTDLAERLEGFYAFVTRRDVLTRLLGFDERYRFYFADSDFQLRCLRELGLQTTQVNHCPIWHFGMASTREAVARGEIDRNEELRHADRIRARIDAGELQEWHDLPDSERAEIRSHPLYAIPRADRHR